MAGPEAPPRAPGGTGGGSGAAMGLRLHRGGRFRRRLAAVFGREPEAGDQIWRRLIHGAGALVLIYYLLPGDFFVVLPKEGVLFLALGVAGALEVLRLGLHVDLPTIRPYEAHRPASFLFYATGLVAAIVLFPEPIAAAAILGTALVDPLIGELRARPRGRAIRLGIPLAVYAGLAAAALAGVGRWPPIAALPLAGLAAVVAIAVERWRFRWLDDDLTMTIVPALVLYGLGILALGLPR